MQHNATNLLSRVFAMDHSSDGATTKHKTLASASTMEVARATRTTTRLKALANTTARPQVSAKVSTVR